MAQIPLNQKIRTIDASVDTTERQSKLINSKSEVYTMGDIVDTVIPYKYLALSVSQEASDNPKYTVLANTLDIDVSALDISRTNVGIYTVRLFSEVLDSVKTAFVVGFNPSGGRVVPVRIGDDRFNIITNDLSGNSSDAILDDTLIEVRVYA